MTDITHANWFGGYYQDVRNQFATMAVDPESWLRVYSEFDIPEDQKKAWLADRTGAIVGIDTAKKYGFKVGQRVPIQGTIYRRPDGGPWEFTIDGIYDSKIKGADKTNLIFHYQYLRETIPERSGFRDRYNWYVFTIDNPDRAPEIAAKIDAIFANSPSETKTNTEKAFVSDWAKQIGDIGSIMIWIVGMAMFTILLVAGNTMAQAIRERINELAVLKTLGFSEGRILWMVLLESVLIALVGGGLGLALSYGFITATGDPTHGLLPAFYFPTPALMAGIVLVVALGIGSRLPARPAGQPAAHRRRVEEKLMLSQIVAVTGVNLRSLRARLGSSTVAVVGIAGVVLVFVAVLSIAEGVNATMKASGDPSVAMILRAGQRHGDDQRPRRRRRPRHPGCAGDRPRRVRRRPGLAGIVRRRRSSVETLRQPRQRAAPRRDARSVQGPRPPEDRRGTATSSSARTRSLRAAPQRVSSSASTSALG